jgi:hypothetical protein
VTRWEEPKVRGHNRLGYRYLDYQIGDDTLPLAKSYILNEFIINYRAWRLHSLKQVCPSPMQRMKLVAKASTFGAPTTLVEHSLYPYRNNCERKTGSSVVMKLQPSRPSIDTAAVDILLLGVSSDQSSTIDVAIPHKEVEEDSRSSGSIATTNDQHILIGFSASTHSDGIIPIGEKFLQEK